MYEQKPFAGGRAYSFVDPRSGEIVDNGQHVLIAGYDGTMRFLDLLGTRKCVWIQPKPRLLFHHPQKGFKTLTLPALPSPAHLAWGVLTCGLFDRDDLFRVLRAGLALLRSKAVLEATLRDWTVEQWLSYMGQSTETRRSLWDPLAIAIMNERCSTASALLFVRSLQKAFLGHWNASAFAVPTVGLSQLFVEPAVKLIHDNGGNVYCGIGVEEVLTHGSLASGVRLEDGSEREASSVILAVPSHRVRSMLPEALVKVDYLRGIESIPLSPIVSIHLWFAADFMREEGIVGIIGRRIQWIFNRRMIATRADGISRNLAGGYVCAVISAAFEFIGMSNDEIVAIAVEDLRSVYGSAVTPPTAMLVIREKRATFSSSPGTENLRPHQRTPIANLFLAGDWTATGYPATIEGAIVSAERCTELVFDFLP
jgi:squalene-associated FAD-dependent desaturase